MVILKIRLLRSASQLMKGEKYMGVPYLSSYVLILQPYSMHPRRGQEFALMRVTFYRNLIQFHNLLL